MYASYFEKDQITLGPAALGHTHDWEHVIVWINNNEVQYVSVGPRLRESGRNPLRSVRLTPPT
jgi:necrosis inducing protein (NPP1)